MVTLHCCGSWFVRQASLFKVSPFLHGVVIRQYSQSRAVGARLRFDLCGFTWVNMYTVLWNNVSMCLFILPPVCLGISLFFLF